MPDPTYRQATMDDAAAIAAIGALVWDEFGERSGLPGRMTDDGVRGRLSEWGAKGAMFVCDAGGGLCGFAAVQPDPSAGSGQAPHPREAVMGVWVAPSARGKGVGTDLALMATDFARAAGYQKLRGTIPEGNESALSFFGEIGSLAQMVGQGMEYELPL
ncbi:MAG: GNAT family N-acetyltransferase [Dehalococcoidia bacterium]|nr:GNAT family N-acetyltransferase [Dehalococcoidia bacterium]